MSNRYVKFIIINLIALFYQSSSFAANNFANTPPHLQSKSVSTIGYSVKPNITFFIDDSGSMISGADGMCYYRILSCEVKDKPELGYFKDCLRWEYNVPFSADRVPYLSISDPPFSHNDPPEKIKKVQYANCTFTRSRMQVVTDVLKKLVDTYRNDFYFSLQPLNNFCNSYWVEDQYGIYRQYCKPPFPKFNKFYETSENKDYEFIIDNIIGNKDKGIKGLHADGGTPTLERLNAVVRNTVINKLKYRCQKSYLILLSDGLAQSYYQPITDSTLERNGRDYGYDGYFDGNIIRNPRLFEYSYNSQFIYALQYYTDTLRTKNFGQFIYKNDVVNNFGSTYIDSTKHSDRRLTDDAGQPWDGPDPLAHLPGHTPNFTQTAQTFTIGLGLIPDYDYNRIAVKLLKYGASPKPDYDPVTNPDSRYYFNALTPESVLDAFQSIFDEIQAQTQADMGTSTIISPMMGESSIEKNNLLIKAKVETEHWSSLLCFHKNNETEQEKNACNKQPSFTNRKLVLNDGTNSYLFSNTLNNGFNNALFKIRDNDNKNNTEWRNGLLNWFSRSTADDQIKQPDFVLDYRPRPLKNDFGETKNMGDMINNPIEAIGEQEFNKQKYLITSANDGMVYVFRATNSDTHPYDLKFNYMPMAMERDSIDGSDLLSHYYQDLTNKTYGNNAGHPHRYLLNGGFTVVQTPNLPNKPQQYFMVSNMGQAARGAFAMNIGGQDLATKKAIGADNLNDTNWYKDLFLFQTTSGLDNKFGYTIGTPAVAITRVNREANAANNTYSDHLRELAFINNGVNFPGVESADNESALYIYDVLGVDVGSNSYQRTDDTKGKLVKKLLATDGNGGLASPVVYDINNDGVADLVYAGDYEGNVYRFDIRDPNPDNWKVTRIFKADGPITAAPTLFAVDSDKNNPNASHQVIVVFGTGSDIYQTDLSEKKQQAIYGIYDDYDQNTMINKSQLLQQTMTYNGKYGELSQLPFSADRYKGWYFNLNADGERVTTKINQLLSTGMVVTRSYDLKKETQDQKPSDPCQIRKTSESTTMLSRLTQFDTQSGGKLNPNDPHFIIYNDDNIITSSVAMDGIVGLRISTINQYHYLDAGKSGVQKTPRADSLPRKCFLIPPDVHLSTGDIPVGGIPMCNKFIFKRLSWREIKSGYSD